MNPITGRYEWQYAGETYSVNQEGQIERAVSWHNGIPTWKPVSGRIALDACAKEIIYLSQLVCLWESCPIGGPGK